MKDSFNLIKSNFASGLVVFLVALPLCLGIALASGAPPLAGIISGIIGGVVVGYLSNSHLSVSGPAAGLTAIVLVGITSLGNFQLFLCAVAIAGIIQLALGFLKAGSISNYFPNNVIEGMLAGIGVIIILKQIPHAIGYDKDNMSQEETIFESGFHPIDYLTTLSQSVHYGAIIIFSVSLLILILWDKFKLQSKIKALPGALVAVTVSILLDEFVLHQSDILNVQQSHLVTLPIVSSFQGLKDLIVQPDLNGFLVSKVWVLGITIAIVASIETLLCIEAADKMDTQKRLTDTNRELKAQGIGNLVSAFLGGLPMTSVVVRTSANVNSGGTHKSSSIIHGILLLLCFIAIPSILNKIPLATLAAVLILVGYKLAKPELIKKFWSKGYYQFIPFVATMIAVVFLDLLKGVGLGLTISIFYILYENLKRTGNYTAENIENVDELKIVLAEEVSFLNKASIKKTLNNIAPNSKIIIDASHTHYMAMDVAELIEDFTNYKAKEENIDVKLIGFKTEYNTDEGDSHIKVLHKRTI